jgi:cytochrome c oxidase subunit II
MRFVRRVPTAAVAVVAVAVVAVAVAAGCGADGSGRADLGLSAAGSDGQDVAIERGCGSCHGVNGEGGVGPAFQGLAGSSVAFDDGTTAVADEAYLIESIRDPNARRVDGYALPMPEVNLSDAEIASIVAYITDLGALTPTTEAP